MHTTITSSPLKRRVHLRQEHLAVAAGLGIAAVALAALPLTAAALLVGGGLFCLLVLLRPAWALYALVPAIPLSSFLSLPLGGVRAGVMELLLALAIGTWLLQMLARQRIDPPLPPLLLPYLIFLFALLASATNTISLGNAAVETLKWVEMLALYWFMFAALQLGHVRWLLAMMLLAGVGQALLGLYQFTLRVGPEGFLLFDGHFMRAYGSFQQPNPYAGYLGLIAPVAFSLFLWSLLEQRKQLLQAAPKALFYLAIFLTLVGGILASWSRGAWLGLAAALVVTSLFRGSRTAVLLGGTVALLLVLFASMGLVELLPAVFVARLSDVLPALHIEDIRAAHVTSANFAAIERLAHWYAALDMWRDHLWTGVGIGNYAVVYPLYAIGRWTDPLGHAHNYYLNIAAETGLLGLSAYLILWGAIIGFTLRVVNRSRGYYRALAAGALGALAHLSVHNFFDNLYVSGIYLHVALVLGIIAIVAKTSRQHPQRTSHRVDLR